VDKGGSVIKDRTRRGGEKEIGERQLRDGIAKGWMTKRI
jgi:hypothetical protein